MPAIKSITWGASSRFIGDLRDCESLDAERLCVMKELAKIRVQFKRPKPLTHAERKRYLWTLVYCKILGYDVHMGEIEAIKLASASTYSEKAAGYIACSLLLADNGDALNLLVNLVKTDLCSRSESIAALALSFLANTATSPIIDNIFEDVSRILNSAASKVRDKAYWVMLRFSRLRPDLFVLTQWTSHIERMLPVTTDADALNAIFAFLLGLFENSPEALQEVQPSVADQIVLRGLHILSRMAVHSVMANVHSAGEPSMRGPFENHWSISDMSRVVTKTKLSITTTYSTHPTTSAIVVYLADKQHTLSASGSYL